MMTLLSSPNSRKIAPGTERSAADAIALNAEGGAAPDWVMLWPRGTLVVGRDKRSFIINDPAAIIAATRPRLPLLVDYEHDYELRKPGDNTPAAGWITDLEARDGAIWGKVEWATKAANAIAEREYRFTSPVYLYRKGTTPMEVVAIDGMGLTHRPNLDLAALNNEQEEPMDKSILEALGLTEAHTAEAVVSAINSLKTPPLTKFVPRADHDLALNRAQAAETKLAEFEKAQNAAKAEALVDGAIAAGKIAPASRDHYLKLAANSFDEVKALVEAAPVVIQPGQDPGLAKGDPASGAGGLSDDQKALCRSLNLSEAEFIAAQA